MPQTSEIKARAFLERGHLALIVQLLRQEFVFVERDSNDKERRIPIWTADEPCTVTEEQPVPAFEQRLQNLSPAFRIPDQHLVLDQVKTKGIARYVLGSRKHSASPA